MFAKPRPKKSPLPPPNKRRKTTSAVEEISFDNDARQEYLSGFHKRKLQRTKLAQEEAAKRARLEKIETRKQLREERKRDVEEHVATVNRILRESGAVTGFDDASEEEEEEAPEVEASEKWEGFPDRPDVELVDHEEEYIDEDRYTTVTVESVLVSRDGFSKPEALLEELEEEVAKKAAAGDNAEKKKATRPPKKKKKDFRYESKFDRKETNRRQKAKHRAKRPTE